MLSHLTPLSLLSPVASASKQHVVIDSVTDRLCCRGGDSGAYRVLQDSCYIVALSGQCCIYLDASILFLLGIAPEVADRWRARGGSLSVSEAGRGLGKWRIVIRAPGGLGGRVAGPH